RHGRLSRAANAGRAPGDARGRTAAWGETAENVPAHLVHDGPAQIRAGLRPGFANGAAVFRRLDGAPTIARRARCGEGDGVRRRGAPAPDSGQAGAIARVGPVDPGRAERGP